MRALDTSQDAASVQLAAYRRMTPEARLRVGLELTSIARQLVTDGVRRRHPEYDDEQVRLAVIRLWLGPELLHAAYPDQPEPAP